MDSARFRQHLICARVKVLERTTAQYELAAFRWPDPQSWVLHVWVAPEARVTPQSGPLRPRWLPRTVAEAVVHVEHSNGYRS